ncbi:Wzz/FepE/Etk N-terminal domain-containing protein [Erwinia rhapontici]|uniref:Wzz/FepE/Etk N-terminal domain-containing protein n=1 Tax=Erwinia rhapontici TaxID=55212 RepID=UPI00143848CE|nr:Wzz/FepE/Etk N-terminal domain-containing protein [Erwinia rhapontici]NKG29781.1 LPS O-antigen chain length determinant protein WzzB [Erwinia rhapontici]
MMSKKNTTNFEQFESVKHDELDLLDIFFQLWKGKWIIIALIVVSLIGAGIYLASVKSKWTSTAILTQPDIGQMVYYSGILNQVYALNDADNNGNNTQSKPGQFSPDILQQTLFNRFSASLAASNLVDIKAVDKALSYPLSISLTADSANHAQEQLSSYIQQVNTTLLNDYLAEIKTNLIAKQSELTASLEAQKKIAQQRNAHRIEVIRYALKIAEDSNISSSQLTQVENLSDDTLYLLGTHALSAMIANEANKPLVLDKQYFDTQTQLLALSQLKPDAEKLQPFTYITQPDLPAAPVNPRKSLVLLLAAILGAIAGSAIVIGRNVVADYRLRMRAE